MADIYNRQQIPVGGVFSSDRAILTVSGAGGLGVGALVQNVQANYAQQMSPVYELGSNRRYTLLGRPEGQLTIGRIVGTGEFAQALFDACSGGGTVSVQAADGFCNGVSSGGFRRTMTGVFVVNYGFDMSTQDQMVRENMQCTFTSMSR